MGLCNKCVFMSEKYDNIRRNHDDVVVDGKNESHHYCPMYDDHVPNDIYFGSADCKYFDSKYSRR